MVRFFIRRLFHFVVENHPRTLMFLMTLMAFYVAIALGTARAETHFLEAESFAPSANGWKVVRNDQTRRASRVTSLWGADGPTNATASNTVSITHAGTYRLWVRAIQVSHWRGAFRVEVSAKGKEVGSQVFDAEPIKGVEDWEYPWQSFDIDLLAGDATITLSKHEQKNCTGYVRHVDCFLLTNDLGLKPDHVRYGPQTLLRVTLRDVPERPVYLHLFTDHYRHPWYEHFAIGRDGLHRALAVGADQMLKPGESSAWCNLSPTVYQDSGVALNLSMRHTYHEKAKRFRAKLEFARCQPGDDFTAEQVEIVKTFDVEAEPNGLLIVAPPDLETPANIARLKRDREFADEIGKLADAFDWPTHGKRPQRFPFLVTINIGGYELSVDAAVQAREQKTVDYFGFNGGPERMLHGVWHMKENSYARPDLDTMRTRAKHDAELFAKQGRKYDDIAACMLMDEPTAQPAAFIAKDSAYIEKFREWIRTLDRTSFCSRPGESSAHGADTVRSLTTSATGGLQPADLLVATWDDVRPVAETERDNFPALHYFTQRFRTRSLGDFLAAQRKILEEFRGRSFPTMVNFSDGPTFHANFFSQGVDYFELLDADDQNAIWGEDWANNSSTYQCAGFNVALMQAAARQREQTVGHYLIAHAGRTPWDTKTKAVSETARGVRMWQNFSYGPSWSSHEGGPPSHSHLWWGQPDLWRANAEITREIGAVEEWLLTAKPAPSDVAIIYSSSSDIWTMWTNLASGFDRMHTWLALAHAQVPSDILSERDVAAGRLTHRVAYLSGPNLTRAAAAQLKSWVESGGTLFLTADAASRDEFNRPLDLLAPLLPADRDEAKHIEPFQNSGRFLCYLNVKDTVTWAGEKLEVFSTKQSLQPRPDSQTLATFADGNPAVVSRSAGKGHVICCGFLPALSYIHPALLARRPLDQKLATHHEAESAKLATADAKDQPQATSATVSDAPQRTPIAGISIDDRVLLDRSYNPWTFPAAIRERILYPVLAANIQPQVTCNTPLIDVVTLPCEQGLLLAISNFSLRPIKDFSLTIRNLPRDAKAISARIGPLPVTIENGVAQITMPLDATDFVTIGR